MKSRGLQLVILVLLISGICNGRIHLLSLTNDDRPIIVMTSFGYLQGGHLEVNITSLKLSGGKKESLLGFSFDKSSSSGTSSYVEREESTHGCVLDEKMGSETFENVPRAILKIVKVKDKFELQVLERGLQGLKFYSTASAYRSENSPTVKPTTSTTKQTTTTLSSVKEAKPDVNPGKTTDAENPDANKPLVYVSNPGASDPGHVTGKADLAPVPGDDPGHVTGKADLAPVPKKTSGPGPNLKPAAGGGGLAPVVNSPSAGAVNLKPIPGSVRVTPVVQAGQPMHAGSPRQPGQPPGQTGGSPAHGGPVMSQGQAGRTPGKTGPASRKRRAAVSEAESKVKAGPPKVPEDATKYVQQVSLPIIGNYEDGMNLSFYVRMETKDQIGLYELYFHNCENIENPADQSNVAFTAHIVEQNTDSYLSAGDMALPTMYGVISAMFFLIGIIWVRMICTTQEKVFKIHYLMAVIIFVKGMSVMFHSLDYYFIAKDGRTEAWAVIYYIVHLLKGILLIICLLLIGTGWAFIKYILSDRDKKLFMIVIPMQVMVNIAYIIMEETEEGNKSYYTWKNIVILVDVLCCGAILIPVVWSIRHLQEASQTDGKAAINLAKLELFRQFYIMVVCYLYFTRIIVYLLEITLPFQYIWIHAFFSELGAFVFFSVTGYKFRPGCDNPYLKLEQYDSDDPEEAITQSGAMENITRVNQRDREDETDEFDVLLPKQRTSKV